MKGEYRVNAENLKPLFAQADKLAKGFEAVAFAHVYREHNIEADALANQAMDEAVSNDERLQRAAGGGAGAYGGAAAAAAAAAVPAAVASEPEVIDLT